eukprot:TRINITY_DN868_c0_g1_i1.p1 TRINITY_DN868_c0_g1~~TRINITY_DN868_c0_g1_i1.p1  ORF type:complete len:501 (-),score=110.22 TRINITY_DN868_c0_g1_i1:141-1643(-)
MSFPWPLKDSFLPGDDKTNALKTATEAQLRAEIITLRRSNAGLTQRVSQLQGLLGELQPLWLTAPEDVQEQVQLALAAFTPRLGVCSAALSAWQEEREECICDSMPTTARSNNSDTADKLSSSAVLAAVAVASGVSMEAPGLKSPLCISARYNMSRCHSARSMRSEQPESPTYTPVATPTASEAAFASAALMEAANRNKSWTRMSSCSTCQPIQSAFNFSQEANNFQTPMRDVPPPPLAAEETPAQSEETFETPSSTAPFVKKGNSVVPPLRGMPGGPPLLYRNLQMANTQPPRKAFSGRKGANRSVQLWSAMADTPKGHDESARSQATPPNTVRHRLFDNSSEENSDAEDCGADKIGTVTVPPEQYEKLLESLEAETTARKHLEKQLSSRRDAMSPTRRRQSGDEIPGVLEGVENERAAEEEDIPLRDGAAAEVQRLMKQEEAAEREFETCLDAVSREWDWHGLYDTSGAANGWGRTCNGAFWRGRHKSGRPRAGTSPA